MLDAGVEEIWLGDREPRRIEVYDRGRSRHLPRHAAGSSARASQVPGGFTPVPGDLLGR